MKMQKAVKKGRKEIQAAMPAICKKNAKMKNTALKKTKQF
jgi:hypothetical protein